MKIIIPYPVIGFDENGFYFGINTCIVEIGWGNVNNNKKPKNNDNKTN